MNHVIICAATRTEAHLIRRHSHQCRIVQCGANGISALLDPLLAHAPAGLVSFGFAGGLAATLAPGTILLPKRLRTTGGHCWPVDRLWRIRVASELDPALAVEAGDLLETRSVVATPAEKRSLHAASGAVAVDMESATLAELASRTGVPLIALRAVIDTSEHTLPPSITSIVGGSGSIRWAALLRVVAEYPFAMMHLLRAYPLAARALVTAMDSAREAIFTGSTGQYPRCGVSPPALAE
jgi:adenosylhomocysteine nucleosidase